MLLVLLFFWVLVPFRLVGTCQYFGETYYLHLQHWRWRQYVSLKRWHLPTSLYCAKTQKNIIILIATKTSNLTKILLLTCSLCSYLVTKIMWSWTKSPIIMKLSKNIFFTGGQIPYIWSFNSINNPNMAAMLTSAVIQYKFLKVCMMKTYTNSVKVSFV
jgi:hypothetical protein